MLSIFSIVFVGVGAISVRIRIVAGRIVVLLWGVIGISGAAVFVRGVVGTVRDLGFGWFVRLWAGCVGIVGCCAGFGVSCVCVAVMLVVMLVFCLTSTSML